MTRSSPVMVSESLSSSDDSILSQAGAVSAAASSLVPFSFSVTFSGPSFSLFESASVSFSVSLSGQSLYWCCSLAQRWHSLRFFFAHSVVRWSCALHRMQMACRPL